MAMKNNYKIVFRFKSEYDKETTLKIASIAIALNGTLYSIDYHGIEHGAKISSTDSEGKIIVIVNECEITPEDIIDNISEILNRYKKTACFSSYFMYSEEPYEIPEEEYTDQYYFNWYNIEEE